MIEKLVNDYKVLIIGGPGDTNLVEKMLARVNYKENEDKNNIYNLTGKTSIKQSVALMKRCKLVVTHDSGPMHMAVASGTKILAIFGPTEPKTRLPSKNAYWITPKLKCAPCYDMYGNYKACEQNNKCMESISVDEVYSKIKSI